MPQTYVRRSASLVEDSVAAVRAYNEGRPLILSLDDLGLSPTASRWQKFLAVPIFAGFHLDVGEGFYAALPVGVVVVASTKSSPGFEGLPTADKTKLIRRLVDVGLSVLRGDDPEEEDE